ncbi:phytochrome [Striga asiatica]|uniref:Phytochrome n=1 Tax=Striga asiatica TaxID=4170 RepID=A0A5A7QSC6_STRAF|nr:phytochrome [Striga asiatica]
MASPGPNVGPSLPVIELQIVFEMRRGRPTTTAGEEDKDVELRLNTFFNSDDDSKDDLVYVLVNPTMMQQKPISGHVIGITCVSQDITYQKLMFDKFVHVQSTSRSRKSSWGDNLRHG